MEKLCNLAFALLEKTPVINSTAKKNTVMKSDYFLVDSKLHVTFLLSKISETFLEIKWSARSRKWRFSRLNGNFSSKLKSSLCSIRIRFGKTLCLMHGKNLYLAGTIHKRFFRSALRLLYNDGEI